MPEPQPGTLFVGRDRELRELLRGLDDATHGRGRLYLVAGEPGIGKSRLADELASRAREAGIRVLWGRGWEDAGAPPYWPWVQVLRSYLRTADPDEIRRHAAGRAGEIAQMVPELVAHVPDVEPIFAGESDSARFQLFDSVASFLRSAAQSAPLLVVLDDLQAADTPSLRFLRFLASQLADTSILILATYRELEVTAEHPLADALLELGREPSTRVLRLQGLGEDSVGRFVQKTAGRVPRAQLVSALCRETGGNPLFVGEALRLLMSEGRLDELTIGQLRLSVPAGIKEVITRRLRHLSPDGIDALRAAAALGPEFSTDVLRRVGAYTPEAVLGVLEEVERAGAVASVTGAVGRYRFTHDLVRETLYDDLTAGERVRLHRRIAETIEELHAGAIEDHLAALAHHYFEAARGGDTDKALGYLRRAAEQAMTYARRAGDLAARSLAYEEAARLYTMALAVLDADESADEEARLGLLISLGDVQARAGDLPTARVSFIDAASIARRRGDGRALARAAIGYGGRFLWPRAGDDPFLVPMLQDALVMLGGDDERLRVRLLTRLACAWRDSAERREESAALSQQAIDVARRLDDAQTLCIALIGRLGAIYWPENAEERLQIAKELLDVAVTSGDAERTIDGLMTLCFCYADLGRMVEARAELEKLARVAEELRQPAQMWLALATRASFALMEGDFQKAADLIERESEPGYPSTPVRDDVSAMRFHRFLLRAERGELAEEEQVVRASASEFPWYPLHRSALVCLLLELGRVDEARSEFAALAAGDFRSFIRDNEWLLGVSLAAEACGALDERQAGEVLYAQLAPFAGAHAIGHPEGSVGAVDRYLGLLAGSLGRHDDAVAHLTEAVAVNERLGAWPWVAHTQADLADALRARGAPGDADAAAEARDRALATARRLGMSALERRLAAMSGAAAAPEPPAPVRPESAAEAIFVREGDFWAIGRERVVRLRHAKGLAYLHLLLANPGREFHVLELAAGPATVAAAGSTSRAAVDGLRSDSASAGEILDPQAKAAYRERLRELQDEVADADAAADPVRAERARAEIDAISAELSAAFGLGGRARTGKSPAERARQSVTKAVRDALRRIRAEDPALGDHLDRAVRTGLYCAYDPDPAAAVTWRTDPGV